MTIGILFKSFLTRASWTCRTMKERRRLLAQLPPLSKPAFDIFLEEGVTPFDDQWIVFLWEAGEPEVRIVWEYAFDLQELQERIAFLYAGSEILRIYGPELDIYEGTTCVAKGQKELTGEQLYMLGMGLVPHSAGASELSDWPYDLPANDSVLYDEEPAGELQSSLRENQWDTFIHIVHNKDTDQERIEEFHQTVTAESFEEICDRLRRKHAGLNWCVIKATDWHGLGYHFSCDIEQTSVFGLRFSDDTETGDEHFH